MRIVADIETDGLLDNLTKVHSLVLRDRDTGALLLSCTDDPQGRAMGYRSIEEGLSLLSEADVLYFHNGISFDIPALKKVYPQWTYRGRLMDTLVVASFCFAHAKERDLARAKQGRFPAHLAGRQSLEAWGHRLGCHKGEYTTWCKERGLDPWAEWRPEMQAYCEQDTETGRALALHLAKQRPSPAAIEIEHELAWYLADQERNGWPFDVEKAYALYAKLSARREELAEQLREHFGWWYAPNGQTTPKRTVRRRNPGGWFEEIHAGCPYTKLKVVEFNPGSRDHIANRLIRLYDWKPKAFTDGGKPQVDEKALKGFTGPIAAPLLEFLLVEKRLGQVSEGKKAWLKLMTTTSRAGAKLTGLTHLHHRVLQNKAVTHRAAHVDPNLAQVPKVGSPYGVECRELYHVPDGWVQVGADASGLELRCLAHYMARYDGGAYGRVILEGKNEDGTDIHSVNRDALGLNGKEGRDRSKTFIYAYLYGAGDPKLGSIIEPGASLKRRKEIGARLRKSFETKIPAMGELVAAVKKKVKGGRLRMPDGRDTYIRHEHAALNSLLQAAGAIICKRWIVEFNRRLTARFGPQGWRGKWVALGWIHDEVQLAVRPEIAAEVCEILVSSIRAVGELFEWRCPLDGEAKLGRNWAETH